VRFRVNWGKEAPSKFIQVLITDRQTREEAKYMCSLHIVSQQNLHWMIVRLSFSLPMEDYVKLSAYNIRGNEVDVIFEGAQGVGKHSYTWNASNLPSGVYYIRLQAGSLVSSQKALLIK